MDSDFYLSEKSMISYTDTEIEILEEIISSKDKLLDEFERLSKCLNVNWEDLKSSFQNFQKRIPSVKKDVLTALIESSKEVSVHSRYK